jgi:hypothetical protein
MMWAEESATDVPKARGETFDHRGGQAVSITAKVLGITVPVILSTTFCLTVPFILLVADALILCAAVLFFVRERRQRRSAARAAESLLAVPAD